MNADKMKQLTERFLEAWNSQDVERVLACYTPDLRYRDPNTDGEVRGAEAMRRYLTRLFGAWTMRWSMREAYPLDGASGGAFLWHASIRRADATAGVELDGMDLVLLDGDRIRRNDVYFDRAVLAALLL